MQELKPIFSSYLTRLYNDHRIVIITHNSDDFGNRSNCENLMRIEHAREILENLKQTIEEYDRTVHKNGLD